MIVINKKIENDIYFDIFDDLIFDLIKEIPVNTKLLLMFSTIYTNNKEVLGFLKDSLPKDISIIGCTTAGEIANDGFHDSSITLVALTDDDIFDYQVSKIDLDKVEEGLVNHKSNIKLKEITGLNICSISLIDALKMKEEHFVEEYNKYLDLPLIGGSAGDMMNFSNTYVFYNKEVLENHCMLCSIKFKHNINIVKIQNFDKIENSELIPTKVDEKNRVVYEFNGKPAVEEYLKKIQGDIKDIKDIFFKHPIGLEIGNEIYVSSPQLIEGNAIKFYSSIKANKPYSVLKESNILLNTLDGLTELMRNNNMKKIKGVLEVQCVLRNLSLTDREKFYYNKIFNKIDHFGFISYGEQITKHINQSSVLLVLS